MLLALLAGEPDSLARESLEACGVTHDRYAEQHALVAWLWQDHGQPLLELEGMGATATELLGLLAAQGIQMPPVSLPEPDRRPWGETVYFPADRLGDVLARLNADLSPGDLGDGIGTRTAHGQTPLPASTSRRSWTASWGRHRPSGWGGFARST